MTPATKHEVEGWDLNARADLLQLISELARHLAVELDYHYEDSDARHLLEQAAALENAAAVLLSNGYFAPDVVIHAVERFMVPDDGDGNTLDEIFGPHIGETKPTRH